MLTGLMSSAQNSTSPGSEVVTYAGQPVSMCENTVMAHDCEIIRAKLFHPSIDEEVILGCNNLVGYFSRDRKWFVDLTHFLRIYSLQQIHNT